MNQLMDGFPSMTSCIPSVVQIEDLGICKIKR